MNSKWLKDKLVKYWPYLLILSITFVYFVYTLIDNKYFFYDDFTALKFVAERSYWGVIIDSLLSRNVDRHKFVGYLVHKALYDTIGLRFEFYFFVLFVIHSINSWLVYWILDKTTKQKWTSLILASIFAYRFYLWWFSNIHVYLAGLFGLMFFVLWLVYLERGRWWLLGLMWLCWPLMVFSYGPSVLLPLALLPATMAIKNRIKFGDLSPLIPFVVLIAIYLPVFVFTPDSMERFASTTNPYKSDFSIQSYLISQSVFLHDLSGKLIPKSVWLTVVIWIGMGLLTLLTAPINLLWLVAFFVALAANSFFVIHTMFYYLYFPIVFLLIYFARQLQERYWMLVLGIMLLVLAPWTGIYQMAFRFRHPAENFEKVAMQKIVKRIDLALEKDETRFKMSNWELTPNLQLTIYDQVIPYFLSSNKRFETEYIYDNKTEVLELRKLPREPVKRDFGVGSK